MELIPETSEIPDIPVPEDVDIKKFKRTKDPTCEELNPTQRYVNQNISMKLEGGVHSPTTCYGILDFYGTPKRETSRFIRCADDTDQEKLFKLFTDYWNVEPPRLIISVTGGMMSFSLDSLLKEDFQNGVREVASTPGAWIITGGSNTGVVKLVGDAVRDIKNVRIGIIGWGIVANRDTLQPPSIAESNVEKSDLCRSGERFSYVSDPYLITRGEALLDCYHTHYILVDDGSVGKWGREIAFRGKFEEYLIQHKPNTPKIPSVLLVLEGGPGTLDTVYEAVKNSTPCVIIEGSGRSADLLVYAIHHADEILEAEEEGKSHDGLVYELKRVYNFRDADRILRFKSTVIKCIKKKEVFTIANMKAGFDTSDAIYTALLKDKSTTASIFDQMRLAILWDRVDLAEARIMSNVGSLWVPKDIRVIPEGLSVHEERRLKADQQRAAAQYELNELMIMALAMNRVDFVKLLLEYNVNVKSLLTQQVVQFLYAYRRNLGLSTLKYELRTDVMADPESRYAPVFEYLQEYNDLMKSKDRIQEIKLSLIRKYMMNTLRHLPTETIAEVVEIPSEKDVLQSEISTFTYPFRQLFLWAVFSNMLDMALLLWEFEDYPICNSLIASEITKGLIRNVRYRDLQDEVEIALELSLSTYQKLALDLLDMCYNTHEKNTELLITMPLELLSDRSSCLDLAVASDNGDFVAHNCVQGILNDIWTGSIKRRHIGVLNMCAYIFCPFLLYNLEIRTRKEMKRMIQSSPIDDSDEEGDRVKNDVKSGGVNLSKTKVEQSARTDAVDREEKMIKEWKRLTLIEKLYYFHVYSPVVRFYTHTISYILFLMLFSYIATVKKVDNVPTGLEILLIITVLGYAVGEIHQVLLIDAPSILWKLKDYKRDIWNIFDCLCILVFVIAIILRCIPSTVEYGHLFYTFDVSLWIIRLIHILYVDPVAGPYVITIGHLFVDLLNFVLILVIFLLAYGIAVKGILEPTSDNAQMLISSVFKPYFHWYGEYFLDTPEDENTTYFGTEKHNSYAEPIALIYMAVYLLIVQLLLLNLVIAIFNSTYERIMATSLSIWKFQRYGLIVEYAKRRSCLCPPLSLIYHLYAVIRWLLSLCLCTCVKKKESDRGLRPSGEIAEQMKVQLTDLENSCLIKLARLRRRGNMELSSTGSEMSVNTKSKANNGELAIQLNELTLQQKAMEEKLFEKWNPTDRDNEMEKIKQCLKETLTTQAIELNDAEKTILKDEIRHLNEQIQKLQIDNKTYLQDIGRKKALLKEKDREIEELKEENGGPFETSGVEH